MKKLKKIKSTERMSLPEAIREVFRPDHVLDAEKYLKPPVTLEIKPREIKFKNSKLRKPKKDHVWKGAIKSRYLYKEAKKS